MAERNDAAGGRIRSLSEDGDALADQGNYAAAPERYWAAWDLLRAPRTEWEAATWLLAAFGDANLLGGDFVAAKSDLSLGMQCPNAIGNRFL